MLTSGGHGAAKAVVLGRDGRETTVQLGMAAIQETGVDGARIVLLPG